MNQIKRIFNVKFTSKVVFGICFAFSVNSQTLDLPACLKMADTANLTLRSAQLDILMNEKQVDAYKSARLPKLTFSGDYRYNAIIPGQIVPGEFFGGAPGTFGTVRFGVPFTLGNTLQLTQVLYNPQVNYALNALEINQKVVEIQQRNTEQQVKQQLASTYFNLQAISKQRSFISGNIISMNKLIANMEAMQKQGLVIGTEVDKLKINRLNLENSQQSLTATQEQLRSLINIYIGLPADAPTEFVSDEIIEQSILIDETTINRPELELLAAQKSLNAEERKGTSKAYLPSLSAYAAYSYTQNINPESNFTTGINAAFIGLKLDWTLFDGLEKYNKQKVNAIQREKIENQEKLITQQLDLETTNAKKQITIQTNSLAISQEQLQLAQRVYKQTEAQFQQGTVSSNDVITADTNLQQAQTNVVSAYIQLRQAELSYLKSIGNIK